MTFSPRYSKTSDVTIGIVANVTFMFGELLAVGIVIGMPNS
jgi:hypothetical protein